MLPPIPMMLRMLMEQEQQGRPTPRMASLTPGQMPQDMPVERGSPAETEALAMESFGDTDYEEPGESEAYLRQGRPDPTRMRHSTKDRFLEEVDPVREETERELDDTHKEMTGQHGDDEEGDWEGVESGSPSDADLEYIKEHPTDGNLASFFKAFPKWTAEDILRQGGNPSSSPDQYAMDDEEWEETQKDRSTEIDER